MLNTALADSAHWPWLAAIGLGAFHGLNPAMGWLFAVALALHRENAGLLFLALLPIAAGHALAVALALAAALTLGELVEIALLRKICGAALIGWAGLLALRGHRGRVRVGLTTGMAGLAAWSFLMASAHGAGLMLLPAALPVARPGADAAIAAGAALGLLGVHTAAMLAVTGLVGIAVHRILGLAVLRRGWVNLEPLWITALVLGGLWLVFA